MTTLASERECELRLGQHTRGVCQHGEVRKDKQTWRRSPFLLQGVKKKISGIEDEKLLKISSSGLVLGDVPPPVGVPKTSEAWRRVVNIAAEPVVKVSQSHPDAMGEVDRQWLAQAKKESLFAEDGSFLISVAGPGAFDSGWVCVKWSENVRLASVLVQDEGSPEFVAMSSDGRFLCAATTEEYDFWIVVHTFH